MDQIDWSEQKLTKLDQMDWSEQNGSNMSNWTDVDQMDRINRSGLNWIESDLSWSNCTKVNEIDQMD